MKIKMTKKEIFLRGVYLGALSAVCQSGLDEDDFDPYYHAEQTMKKEGDQLYEQMIKEWEKQRPSHYQLVTL